MDIIELNRSNINRHPWELARFEILFQMINHALPLSNNKKIIVDIGCGDLFFANQILKKRPDVLVIGIDTALTQKDIKDNKTEDLLLFQNLYEASNYFDIKKADLILLLDVIEHIKDDEAFLKEVISTSFIDRRTQFLISVPAFQSLFTNHDVFLKHYRRYTIKSLKQTISKAGLVPIKWGYFFTSLLPVRFIEKILEKKDRNKKQKGIGDWKKKKLTGPLKNYLLFDFKISKTLGKIGIQLPGLSVYCLCKKPV